MPSSGPAGLAAIALAGASLALGSPGGFNARQFPAHDSHQGVTIAAVPVPDTLAAEKIFGKKAAPTRAGFLPVELVVSNERAESIRVRLHRIKVFTDGDQFDQADPETVALVLYPLPEAKHPDLGPKPRLPIPWPRGDPSAPKDKKRAEREEAEAALRSRQLRAAVVGPGAYARGYLYFDLVKKTIRLEESSVYVPAVEVEPSGEGLLFFEISLKPYARPGNP